MDNINDKIENNLDYSYFINPLSSRRRPALTRELTKLAYLAPKEAISLAEGMPNESTFPFERFDITMKDGSVMSLKGSTLGAALQYIPTQGYPPLLKTLKDFTLKVHNPPNWNRSDVLITNGSQDGLSKALEMCIQEGEPLLVQNPLYAGIEIIISPVKSKLLPVDQDQYGLNPEELRSTLEDWKEKCLQNESYKMPKMIYINPTGSNPTGTSMTLERKRQIYEICCEYNIIILEDDAYYFLHFLDELVPSFLSMDVQGRVLRFDSFSKVLSSGLRLGWVTGPKQLIQAIELHIQSSTLHSSTLSQVITNNLLQSWGFEKLLEHFDTVSAFYRARRDITIEAMEKHLKGLCEWTIPAGGMFVWIKVHGVTDVYDMLMNRGLKKLITFVPGHAFMADPTKACNYIRASYSKCPPKHIDKAIKILGELIREERELLRIKLENCT
ncbi:kynurenine/alpha-aminoadipate aminotransferase, mitochondrial [Onthophagus taurus]|uniref:kynurenine/alpha-aminoadipate aminotransferase, mitochondrial n=1 Tax=Onthophagus taurus TaxID=166361 RepID=UPI000C20BD79|nr:kynurenine/alpha-aminoadipate aminotransferase, mitochondrial [Onthophagus taurus]